MEAKVKIVVTNVKEFHELYQELQEAKSALNEVLEKIEKFDLKIDMVKE